MSLTDRVTKALEAAREALVGVVAKAESRRFKVKIKGQDTQPDVVVEGDSWPEIGAHVEATAALQAAAKVLAPTLFHKEDPLVNTSSANPPVVAASNETVTKTAPHSVQKQLTVRPWTHQIKVFKTEEVAEERFVLGIVLEPETVDAQNDIYAAEEIRKAAHGFMEHYGHIGLMHKGLIDDSVKILESYVAPTSFILGNQIVKAGTWMLGARIVKDELWDQVKSGEFNGWSIGGTAIKEPEPSFEQLMSVLN